MKLLTCGAEDTSKQPCAENGRGVLADCAGQVEEREYRSGDNEHYPLHNEEISMETQ